MLSGFIEPSIPRVGLGGLAMLLAVAYDLAEKVRRTPRLPHSTPEEREYEDLLVVIALLAGLAGVCLIAFGCAATKAAPVALGCLPLAVTLYLLKYVRLRRLKPDPVYSAPAHHLNY